MVVKGRVRVRIRVRVRVRGPVPHAILLSTPCSPVEHPV